MLEHLRTKPAAFPHAWFRDFGLAAEYAQIDPDRLPLPALWLVRAADKSDELDAEARAANITLGFDAVIAIENIRAERAGETDDVLLSYRDAVRTKLQGWEIEAGVRPIKFKGGKVLEYSAQDIYWADRYEFSALITNYLPDPGAYDSLVYTGAPAL
ncbi:phage tail terminator protein [Methylomonas sp. HW2-6]|uniref:phage tail terminator protein n=1 Tax=Methylomonas sp. HW2-6 TaxID=3376687 RepID=UPI004041632C